MSRFTKAMKDKPLEVSVNIAKEDVMIPTELTVGTTQIGKEENSRTVIILKVDCSDGESKMILLSPQLIDGLISGLMDARSISLAEH